MSVVKPTFKVERVELKRTVFDVKGRLMKSTLLPWAPVEVDSANALPAIREAAPLAHDVVEWMQISAADMAVFDAMAEDYNRLGSKLVSASGDPYIPGVKAVDIRGESLSGYTVRARGYGTVITPQGSFNVPVKGKATFAKGDVLAWAALPDPGTGVQWVLTLLQWLELATAPIRDRVRFGGSRGLVAPNFFSVSPRLPVPALTMRIGLTSDKPQAVAVKGRGTKGSFENVLFEDKFDVDAGESEVVYTVLGFPIAPSFTLELQPSDNTQTVLDYIELFP